MPDVSSLGLSPSGWLIGMCCGVLVGFTKTGIGGLGIVIVPFMAMIFPAQQSPGVLLPMLIVGDVFAVAYYHRHAVWSHLIRPMPWAAAGIVGTYFLLKYCPVSDDAYRRLIGSITLLCAVLTAWKQRRDRQRAQIPDAVDRPLSPAVAVAVGLFGGFATMAANVAGPVWIIYLIALGLPKLELVGTGAWFFLILNVFKVPFQISLGNITAASVAFNLATVPAIIGGALIGILVLKRIRQDFFNATVHWLAAIAALKLLLS